MRYCIIDAIFPYFRSTNYARPRSWALCFARLSAKAKGCYLKLCIHELKKHKTLTFIWNSHFNYTTLYLNLCSFYFTVVKVSLPRRGLLVAQVKRLLVGYYHSNMTEIRPVVVSGPSGCGKSTLVKRLMTEYEGYFAFSVSRKWGFISLHTHAWTCLHMHRHTHCMS